MYANRSARSYQEKALSTNASEQDATSFFNLLTGPEIFDTIESLLPAHRERMFPPTETLAMFLSQALKADRSCQRTVNEAATHRLISGLKPCSTFTGGYCKARQRLPLNMVSALVRQTGSLIDQQIPEAWRWHGRAVRIIDGTTVTMPDTPDNQAIYPQQVSQKPGLGFSICRIVGITCLSSGAVLNAAMGPYKGKESGESALLRSLMDTFEADDILLGDALYGSYFLLAECQARCVDPVTCFDPQSPISCPARWLALSKRLLQEETALLESSDEFVDGQALYKIIEQIVAQDSTDFDNIENIGAVGRLLLSRC